FVYYWGGGHKTYGGNDIDAYNIAKDKWVQLTQAENWNNVVQWFGPDLSDQVSYAQAHKGEKWAVDWLDLNSQQRQNREQEFFGTSLTAAQLKEINKIAKVEGSRHGGWEVNILSPRGRPLVKHSYGQMAWWPGRGYCLLKQRFWCYDPQKGDADGAWSDLGPNPYRSHHDFDPGGSIAPWNLTYDPKLGTVVTVSGTGNNGKAYKFNPSTGRWDLVIDGIQSRAPNTYSEVYSAYNPASGWHVVYAGQQWQRLNFATGETKSMAQLRSHLAQTGLVASASGYNLESFSITWAPELGKALVAKRIDGKLRLWTYDPKANSWSDFHLKGTGPQKAHAKWDTLARDPLTGVYVFLAKDNGNADPGQTPQTWTFWLRGSSS
ncbi:MAG TPA: hypothetical protein VKA48_12120, partial [Gammaproteobacteria bacterium]|nr:hypothetical protein [Gammaproteobacteria bacterium]